MNEIETPFSPVVENYESEDKKEPVSVVDGVEYGIDSSGTIRRKIVKVERNDPCPCGSGLKFKKCQCN